MQGACAEGNLVYMDYLTDCMVHFKKDGRKNDQKLIYFGPFGRFFCMYIKAQTSLLLQFSPTKLGVKLLCQEVGGVPPNHIYVPTGFRWKERSF